jgi:hypothetical protein
VKDLYNGNHKPLNKEIKEDYRRWKDLPCSWISRYNIVEMALFQNQLHVQYNPIKIPITFITDIENSTLKFIEAQKTLSRQGNT